MWKGHCLDSRRRNSRKSPLVEQIVDLSYSDEACTPNMMIRLPLGELKDTPAFTEVVRRILLAEHDNASEDLAWHHCTLLQGLAPSPPDIGNASA